MDEGKPAVPSTPGRSRPSTAAPPTEEELEFFFNAFDRDEDGTITLDELVDILRACGMNPTQTEARAILIEYDKNISDGSLDFEECKELLLKQWKHSNAERELIEAFRVIDDNKNGFIEKHELKHVLMNYGDDKLSAHEVDDLVNVMVSIADVDMNNKIDYFEFARVLTSRVDWKNLEGRSLQRADELAAAEEAKKA